MIHRRAQAIHDELSARALVLACDGRRVAIVALDLIWLAKDQVQRIRQRVRQLCALEASSLVLCCSHTHAGPATNAFRGWGAADPAYIGEMVETVSQCVARAAVRLAPCTLAWGEAPLQVGYNRRLDRGDGAITMAPNPAAAVDQVVRVLRVDACDTGQARAVLFAHGCHPVVIHRSTPRISSDYCGFAAASLEERLGPESCAMFLQGCGGDANPVPVNGTFEDRALLGGGVAAAVHAAMAHAQPVSGEHLGATLDVVAIPTRVPTVAEAREALAAHTADVEGLVRDGAAAERIAEAREYGVQWAQDLMDVAAAPQADHRIPMDIAAIRLGPSLGLVGLAAEPFFAYERICREVSPWPNTLVVGYVNGATQYLPTAAEFARGGYEVAGRNYADTFPYAHKRYGTLAFTPECEQVTREAVARAARAAEVVKNRRFAP